DFRQTLTVKSKTGTEFIEANEEILARLNEILSPLFSQEKSDDIIFITAEDDSACHYCQFSSICSK
ncbi:MAG: hypothetical protein K2G40_09545, partial [Muribaculaceae bacterium]|nr:hypothetical protein [Muribaculaceae bacterium]